jgi:hypothetical protein
VVVMVEAEAVMAAAMTMAVMAAVMTMAVMAAVMAGAMAGGDGDGGGGGVRTPIFRGRSGLVFSGGRLGHS